ncbi:MAG: hypothetical protein RIS94_3128 [Pseudomonadota bacterium]|jgi:two-component system phosphate regulon response regulator PhoB
MPGVAHAQPAWGVGAYLITMARKPVILLQESDATRRRMMKFNLEIEGFGVIAPAGPDDAGATGAPDEIDLTILNWEGLDRVALAAWQKHREVPGRRYVPLLVIGGPEQEDDRMVAYQAGADDIMTNPFSVPELLARIRAILRRTSPELGGRVIRVAGLSLDVNSGRVTREGADIRLSQTEFRILQYLMEHAGKVRTREQIRNAVWERPSQVEIRAIDVRITRLRRQLRLTGGSDLIRTVRSVGYVLADEQPRMRVEPASGSDRMLLPSRI